MIFKVYAKFNNNKREEWFLVAANSENDVFDEMIFTVGAYDDIMVERISSGDVLCIPQETYDDISYDNSAVCIDFSENV